MTDEQIKKALKYCQDTEGDSCQLCEYLDVPGCQMELSKDALDLINRQQAEIEEHKAERKIMLEEDVYSLADQVIEQQAEIEKLNYILIRDNQRQTEKEQKDGNCILDLYDLYDKAVDENKKLNAEIERLKVDAKRVDKDLEELDRPLTEIRAEAIKELEAKIHEKLHEAEMHGNFEPVVTREMFDSVVKELVGETDV